MDDEKLYDIICFRQDGDKTRVRTNLTFDEARAHCSNPLTSGDGWFHGYAEVGSYPTIGDELDDEEDE